MKIFKGCLIIIVFLLSLSVAFYFVYKNSVISTLDNSSKIVETNWKIFTKNLHLRNKSLIQQNISNDSLKYFIEKSNQISLKSFSRELEFNEYKINEKVIEENIDIDLEDRLNSSIDIYNQSVRDYNLYRITFPNSLIARKTKFPKTFNYFDLVKYGIKNKNPQIKRAKMDNWIKFGGEYPE